MGHIQSNNQLNSIDSMVPGGKHIWINRITVDCRWKCPKILLDSFVGIRKLEINVNL